MAQLTKIRLGQPNLTRRALMRMRGLGVIHNGQEIPEDLVQAAAQQGAVIVYWDDAIESIPDSGAILAGNPSSSLPGGGYAVVTDAVARANGVDVVYDPIAGASGGSRRGIWSTMLAAGLATLIVGGIAIVIARD